MSLPCCRVVSHPFSPLSGSHAQGAGLLSRWASSDGIIIDDTVPVCVDYRVRDGLNRFEDAEFQRITDSAVAQWRGAFFDLESQVSHFTVELRDAVSNETLAGPLPVGTSTSVRFDKLGLSHTQRVETLVTAHNRAGISKMCKTSGMSVDVTPPLATHNPAGVVWDGNAQMLGYEGVDMEFSRSPRAAHASWTTFADAESGVHNYWVWAEDMDGVVLTPRHWVHPSLREWTMPIPTRSDGDRFRVAVQAVNMAGSRTTFRSDGVVVDTSPPFFTTGVEFSVDGDAAGLEPGVLTHTDAKLRVRVSAAEKEGSLSRCTYAMGTVPDASDVTGVTVLPVQDMAADERTQVGVPTGGDNICDDAGVCTTMPVGTEMVTKTLTLDRVVNPESALVNNLRFHAWVSCANS